MSANPINPLNHIHRPQEPVIKWLELTISQFVWFLLLFQCRNCEVDNSATFLVYTTRTSP